MNERHAAALGALVRTVSLMLSSPSPDIGLGRRMNLLLPVDFGTSEHPEKDVGGIEAASLAPVGEFLRVDCHLVDNLATRSMLLVFLRSAFEPIVVGFGKFRVMTDDGGEGIIFVR
ncbi:MULTISPECIES: hypothetical protein [unclassified Pseudomonas]|uniref:hypothetical protein n=1 Tax=unclassified Pseudomonas TaxID=196821 RepID=UPI0013EB8F20|nr:hypothetical protein [Pseudomonas sp. SWI36]